MGTSGQKSALQEPQSKLQLLSDLTRTIGRSRGPQEIYRAAMQVLVHALAAVLLFDPDGVGLAVVRGIVRDHRGAINLVSAPGKGTKIAVLLPCVGETAQSTHDAVTWASEKKHRPRSGIVLVVEDEETLRLPVSKMLVSNGYGVIEAGDGSSALEQVRAHKDEIDVMLLDVTLPGVSSREVLDEARRVCPKLRVILTSAYSRPTIEASFAGLGIDRFIRKPFQIVGLLALLQDVLSA